MPDEKPLPPRNPYQFSVGALLLAMALISVLAASMAGMLQPQNSGLPRGFFVIMATASPMVTLLAVGLFYSAARWISRRR